VIVGVVPVSRRVAEWGGNTPVLTHNTHDETDRREAGLAVDDTTIATAEGRARGPVFGVAGGKNAFAS